ncbi:MAG: energy transducer TonB, partial [Steroidobacteraceae bacterium]
ALNNCYPSASRRLNEEGRVVMVVTISIYGQMMHAHLAQSSGFSRLDEAAVCVLRQLTFNPGTQDGQPVESQATMPITFRLE